MKTTMDKRGRIVIPKALREEMGMLPGMKVEIFCEYGNIILRPIPTKMHAEKRGRFTFIVPDEPIPPMDADLVEKTIQDIRDERMRSALGGFLDTEGP